MRDFLDAILSFIGAASLTNDEFNSLDLSVQEYSVEVYEALHAILTAREQVSNLRDKLKYYFLAKGVNVTDATAATSKLFLGAVLCD